MDNIYIVYDDSVKVNYNVSSIIGEKSFGEVVYKRKNLQERFFEGIGVFSFVNSRRFVIKDNEDILGLSERIIELPDNAIVLHMFSNMVVTDNEKYSTLIQKLPYIKDVVLIQYAENPVGMVFPGKKEYEKYLKVAFANKSTGKVCAEWDADILQTTIFKNMNQLQEFLQYITGGFDARFFNSLSGNEYVVTKSSTNIKKIKSEYMYYHLLPEKMQRWFVLPYDYKEENGRAYYTMERLHMADVAIRWVHGAFDEEEFKELLEKLFYFINSREKKEIDAREYRNIADNLYLSKVQDRIEELKAHEMFPVLKVYIENGTDLKSIEAVFELYENLYKKVKSQVYKHPVAVIGHGDLCFSNMLYNKEAQMLKFIDVKGALKEEDLWMNPFYDIAKLSHSICGRYDFFNNNMFEIKLNMDLKLELEVDFDNTVYIEIFKKFLEKNGFDFQTIRILEASLFLSMLPLHMDNPKKVYGFLLNAINIMRSVEYVK